VRKPIAGNPSFPTPRLLLGAALIALTASASSQTPNPPDWQTAAGGKLRFDVASVRQSAPNAPYAGNVDLEGSDYFVRYHGGLVTTDGSLISYIAFAYKIQDASNYPLLQAQLPKWAETEQLYVEARPEGTPTKDQIRLMMQSLLADRFKLAIHTETRQLPMYALMLDKPGKPGPQLLPHPDDGLCTKMPDKSPPPARNAPPAPWCALIVFTDNPQLPHMRMMDFTMEQIAGGLETVGVAAGGLDRIPILDRTGLTGKFDINLEFQRQPKPGQPPTPESEPAEPGPSFVEALKTQAGLKLVKQIGPVDVYIIDHVEPPSEN
jgi:uncharacterized protein (TIGR03435 family)